MYKNKHEPEIKEDIAKRLEKSNGGLWKTLSLDKREKIVNKYYNIREVDYSNINFILRANADSRREFSLIFLGLLLGIFGNVLADLLVKYSPHDGWLDDLRVGLFFILLLYLVIVRIFNEISKSLGDDHVLERLVEIVEAEEPKETK